MTTNVKTEMPSLVCIRLTAAGRGAIAVVEVRGSDAATKIEQVFRAFSNRPLSDCLDRKLIYGVWRPTGEDVVVCNLARAHFEIHCHGGTAAVDSIVSTLIDLGAVETTTDANAGSNWRTEVRRSITQATTERTASLLLRQLTLLPESIAEIQKRLAAGQLDAAVESIDQLLAWSEFGVSLTQVPSVVLCGQPNVGKSSLINAIVGFQRAIVHETAGTTRDVVSQRTAVDGWPIELSDTAGLRNAEGPVEEIGIDHARRKIDDARLVVGVFDASKPWDESDQATLDVIGCNIVVHNKCDQGPASHESDRPLGLSASATENLGIDQLVSEIARKLVPELPPAEAAYCVTPEAVRRLEDVRRCLLENHVDKDDRCAEAGRLLSGDTSGSTAGAEL